MSLKYPNPLLPESNTIYTDCQPRSVSFLWHTKVHTDKYYKIMKIYLRRKNSLYYKIIYMDYLYIYVHVYQ